MLDLAEFGGKIFLIYYKGSNNNRTLVGELILLFRGVFFARIKKNRDFL
jgi:hypothetical protein